MYVHTLPSQCVCDHSWLQQSAEHGSNLVQQKCNMQQYEQQYHQEPACFMLTAAGHSTGSLPVVPAYATAATKAIS